MRNYIEAVDTIYRLVRHYIEAGENYIEAGENYIEAWKKKKYRSYTGCEKLCNGW